MLQFCS